MLCSIMLHYVMLHYAMLRCITQCYNMLHYITIYYLMLCYVTVQAIHNIPSRICANSYELFLSSTKNYECRTNFVYKVHIRIHAQIRTRIRENKRKNSYLKFQKFVHEF